MQRLGGIITVKVNGKVHQAKGAFTFDKCEAEGYCEERPSVIAMDGAIIDAGGPLFG